MINRFRSDDDGLTLIELLVTVAIMGIAFLALLGGLSTAIVSADSHRKQANAQAMLRSFSEAVQADEYKLCALPADYLDTYASPIPNYTPAVVTVAYWDGDRTTPTAGASFPSSDPSSCSDHGLQKVTLEVIAPDAKVSVRFDVLKRCVESPSTPTCPTA